MDTQAELKLLVEPKTKQIEEANSFAKKALNCCGSGVLIMLAVYCTIGAVVSAFSLPVETGFLFWIYMISTAIVATIAVLYKGKGLLVLFFPAFLLFMLTLSAVVEGGKWVIHEISFHFSLWLPVSALFAESYDPSTDPTAFLCAAGILLSLLLGFAISLRRSVFATIAITAPFVFLTFVITNLNSDVIYLFGLISVYLTLLICGTVKPDNFTKRGLIVLPSFVIAIVFMIVAYLFAPQGQYAREEQIAALSARFRVIVSQMGRLGQYFQTPGTGTGTWDMSWLGRLDTGLWQFNTSDVSIADAGDRFVTNQSLLEITATGSGTFYLRGYSMQSFDGRSWYNRESIPDELDFTARRMPGNIAFLYSLFSENENYPAKVQMEIVKTGDITPRVVYEPYYSANHIEQDRFDDIQEAGHRFYNIRSSVAGYAEEMTAEDFSYIANRIFREDVRFPDNSSLFPIDALHAYANVLDLLGIYTEIDSSTARELRQIAIEAGIDPTAERTVIVDAVSRYVRSAGGYTLTPDTTPANEDFALHFLRDLREGYCIHFATVAVLSRRELDIPARFTSGYVVTVAPGEVGQTIVLTDLNAHAWVEVFYEDIGWLFMEATPSGSSINIPASIPHTPEQNNDVPDSPEPTPENNIPDNPSAWDFGPDDINNGNMPDAGTGDDSGTGSNNTQQEKESSVLFEIPRIVILLLCIPPVTIIIIVRRNINNKTREKNFKQRNSNKAVIYMWRYIKKLGRNEAIIPHDIEELALKARFSQHRMTEEERAFMTSYVNRLAFEINSGKNEWGRLWLKYIRALC